MMTFIGNKTTQKENKVNRFVAILNFFATSPPSFDKKFLGKMNENSFLCVFKLTLYNNYNKKKITNEFNAFIWPF